MNSSEAFPVAHCLCWSQPRYMTPSSFLHLPKEMKEREYRQKIFEKMSVGLPIKLDNEIKVTWYAVADFRLKTFFFLPCLTKDSVKGDLRASQAPGRPRAGMTRNSSRRMPWLNRQNMIRVLKLVTVRRNGLQSQAVRIRFSSF